MKILLNQNSDAGKPASEPAAAAVVAAGKKTERELELETENESLKAAVEKTAAAKRKAEIDAGHLADENHRLKQIPVPPVKPATEKLSWMGFGSA